MSDTRSPGSGPQLRAAPLITGAVIAGAGIALAIAGVIIGGSHVLAATRRWVNEMEVPPGEQAKLKWTQAKAAAAAGADAWHNAAPAHAGQQG